jgi:zinc finger CCHC domain-containing protein 9
MHLSQTIMNTWLNDAFSDTIFLNFSNNFFYMTRYTLKRTSVPTLINESQNSAGNSAESSMENSMENTKEQTDLTKTETDESSIHVNKKSKSRHRPKKTTEETTLENLTKQEYAALKRRSRRERRKEHNMECFKCRTKGHSIKNCPAQELDTEPICYRCGSLEHAIAKCDRKTDSRNPMPYAFCFKCKQKGHLIAQCPENPLGMYPNGGSCRFCNSVRHLAWLL